MNCLRSDSSRSLAFDWLNRAPYDHKSPLLDKKKIEGQRTRYFQTITIESAVTTFVLVHTLEFVRFIDTKYCDFGWL